MANDVKSLAYTLLEDDDAFEAKIKQWSGEPYLAIDTEFIRENTFYAKPGLIQIAHRHGVDLIDPLKINKLPALASLLSNESIVKIMHSMSEDVELLHHITGVQPSRVFDTQTAAAFLGQGATLGYQSLVAQVLGLELDKSETRSNWLKRPLSDRQLEYAAKDALFLIQLYQNMCPQLDELNLLDAVFEESQFVITQNIESWQHPDLAYLRLKAAWDLSPEQQNLLKNLVIWRDQMAKQKNAPKPWVFCDRSLISIAQKKPQSISELQCLKAIKPKSVRLYGELLLEYLSKLEPGQVNSFIEIEKPLKGDEQALYRALKKEVDCVAESTGIISQLLGSRKMLERVVIHHLRHQKPGLPVEFMGWRKTFLGEKLIAAMSNEFG